MVVSPNNCNRFYVGDYCSYSCHQMNPNGLPVLCLFLPCLFAYSFISFINLSISLFSFFLSLSLSSPLFLSLRCEQSLISSVTVRNCIRLYQTSEEHSAGELKKYCLKIISNHWVREGWREFKNFWPANMYTTRDKTIVVMSKTLHVSVHCSCGMPHCSVGILEGLVS